MTAGSRLLLLLLVLLAAWPVAAQTPAAEAAAPAAAPDPRRLKPGWWDYIAGAGDELPARAAALREAAEQALASRGEPPGPEELQSLETLRVNLQALPEQLRRAAPQAPPPVSFRASYSLDEYRDVARRLREGRKNLARAREDMLRDEQGARAAERRLDGLTVTYRGLGEGDPARLSKGLEIMAARSALAVTQAELAFRRAAMDASAAREAQLAQELEHARRALSGSEEELATLESRLSRARQALEVAQTELRSRQSGAVGVLGETPAERAEAAYRQQRVVAAQAAERLTELDVVSLEMQHAWLGLALPQVEGPSIAEVQALLARAGPLVDATRLASDDWARRSERELAALRVDQTGETEAELRRLDTRRLELAQHTLQAVDQARDAAADLEDVSHLLILRIAEDEGTIVGWLAAAWAWLGMFWSAAVGLLSAGLFKFGDTPVTTLGLLRVVLILFVAFWLSRLVRHMLERFSARQEHTQPAFYTVGRLIHYALIALAVIIGLSSIGVGFSNLALIAGALSVGIGFGLQSIVSNFVSGLIILFERSLKVGDYVQLDSGVSGLVKEINIRSTLINTNENLDVLVPNSQFVSGTVTNWTLKEASRRMHIPFGVAYGTDKELVRKAVLEAASRVEYTVKDESRREPQVWLVGFGDSSLDFQLVVWVKQASVRRPGIVQATYTWEIETALGKHGIEIPFPQRDLHLRSGFERAVRSPEAQTPAVAAGPRPATPDDRAAGGG